MKTSPMGVAELAGHEGIVTSPYKDSEGIWTFGVGHTASAGSPDPATMPKGEDQPLNVVIDLFRRDLAKYEDRVNRAVTVPLAQHEFDALVSFDYNTGGIFRAQLTKNLNAGDKRGAALAFDGWHKPPTIIGRRNREQALFRDGTYSHGGRATIYSADARGRVNWSDGRQVDVLALLAAPSAPIRQPDDPGPESPERPPAAPQTGNSLLRVLVTGIAGAALAALRKPIGRLFHMAFREDGTMRVLGIAGLAVIAGAVGALIWWAT